MPQMSPLMWSFLFSLFSLVLFLSLVKIYFGLNLKHQTSLNYNNQSLNLIKFTWMW